VPADARGTLETRTIAVTHAGATLEIEVASHGRNRATVAFDGAFE